jgi:hypothetical protein
MRIFVPILIILLAGCQTPRPSPVVEPLPIAAPINRTELRIPATVVEYTLGAFVDPNNPLIRHEAHRIQRLEQEARWDLRPAQLVGSSQTHEVSPSEVEPEMLMPSPAKELVTTLAPTEVIPSAPTTAPLATEIATNEPPAPALAVQPDFGPAILPNASGTIDLVAISAAEDPDVNPFKVRQLPDAQIHEIELKIGGIIQGPKSCVLLNGRTLKIGERFESLTLVGIEADAALFRHRQHLMRIPVSTVATQIRLAL